MRMLLIAAGMQLFVGEVRPPRRQTPPCWLVPVLAAMV